MRTYLVGRLATDAVQDGRSCSLLLTTGRREGRAEQHDVHVVGVAASGCAGLRADALVAVEGRTIGPRRMVASRVRSL